MRFELDKQTDIFSPQFDGLRKVIPYEQKKTPPARMGRGYIEVEKHTKKNVSYEAYLEKMADLDTHKEAIKPLDLLYLFRDKAREVGNRYVTSNIQKDLAVWKRALTRYSALELIQMIKFAFESEQVYVEKKRIQPTLFCSNWTNTLLPDSELWMQGKFFVSEKKAPVREWGGTQTTESSKKIGEW